MKLLQIIFVVLLILMCAVLLNVLSSSRSSDPRIKDEAAEEVRIIKKILLWNSFFRWKDFRFGFGIEPFFRHHCRVKDCLVTDDRTLAAPEDFDAVVFHGAQFYPKKAEDYPASRSPRQLYAYYSLESPDIFGPTNNHNDRFNVTITYRLDSDIHFPYFIFKDMEGRMVAPARDPPWMEPTKDRKTLKAFYPIYERKSKPVAWFVSRCASPNKRLQLAKELQKYVSVDIYGKCGTLECPRSNETECFNSLNKDYFFYLAYENSNCVDYVTEKLYNAYTNDVVPIVFNGADMKRFAPPHSYLDASEMTPQVLADRIKHLISNPEEYSEYFWWKDYYQLQFGSAVNPFCTLCEMLHDEQTKPKSYSSFVDWFRGPKGNPMCKH